MKSFDLRNFRRDNKLTQEQLAKMLGVTQAYISEVEIKGRRLSVEAEDILVRDYPNFDEYLIDDGRDDGITIQAKSAAINVQDLLDVIKTQQETIKTQSEQIKDLIAIIKNKMSDII